MASPASVHAIADRAEIHKSCRSLENIVNLLNDYCEAARAVVTLQKKLAKALKDAAGLKAAGEVAANALGTSASVFEVLSDVDAKFAKLIDRECDAVSGEVKKWFKKLAKEEKQHDEKITNANAKIKQAGQLYEKKVKKNSYDAVEEHARYMHLLTSIGPEVSQEKYNHSLMVSQRNTAITYSVAACLSRVADAEWLRSTEDVRRFSPLVGPLGEWRTLCEAGWTGSLPGDLPDISAPPERTQPRPAETVDRLYSTEPSDKEQGSSPVLPQRAPQVEQTNPDTLSRPFPSVEGDKWNRSLTSLASLASFPTPPSHFPLPPVSGSGPPSPVPPSPIKQHIATPPDSVRQPTQPQSRTSSDISHSSSAAAGASGTLPRVVESPREEKVGEESTPALTDGSSSPATPREVPPTPSNTNARISEEKIQGRVGLGIGVSANEKSMQSLAAEEKHDSAKVVQPPADATQNTQVEVPQRTDKGPAPSNSRASSYTVVNTFKKGDYLDEKEFGVEKGGSDAQMKTRSLDAAQSRRVERTDTMKSSGSVVATMREKYARSTGPASPPPRDVPRLPLSVTNLASKYQTISESSGPPSPQKRAFSPSTDQRQPLDILPPPTPSRADHRSFAPPGTPTSAALDDISRRRQRIEELEELERREQILELRARERELDLRARERDRGRAGETLRGRAENGYVSDTSPSRQPMLVHRPYSQGTVQSAHLPPPSLTSRYSHSTTNLHSSHSSLPPPSPISPRMMRRSPEPAPVHPPNCTCPACTVARYAAEPAPSLRPPEKQKTGWRRRLSMPVMMGLDSKKDKGAYAVGAGIASSKNSPGGVGGLDDANRSVASFGRR